MENIRTLKRLLKMNKKIAGERVIVSLTSFPEAIPYAVQAIRSVLHGSVLPDKIVLYLTFSQFGDNGIPQELSDLAAANPIFEIRNYDRDIRSYRKLIPALADFPDAVIVTIDDDAAYDRNMLRGLLRLHKQLPDAVLAHRVRHIRLDVPYRQWKKYKWYHFLTKRIRAGYDNLQTGVGGVLYPPHCLKKEMLDAGLFTEIAPTTDDIWFWAAAVANGTKIVPVPFGKRKPRELDKPRELSLKLVNFRSGVDRNSAVMRAVLEKYPIIRQRLEDGK